MDRTNPAGCLYLDEQHLEQPRLVSAFLPIGHWMPRRVNPWRQSTPESPQCLQGSSRRRDLVRCRIATGSRSQGQLWVNFAIAPWSALGVFLPSHKASTGKRCKFRPSREKLHPVEGCRLATTKIVELGPRRERAGAEDRCITTLGSGVKLVEDLVRGGWVSAQQSF